MGRTAGGRVAAGFLIACALGAAAPRAQGGPLRWKFTTGETLHYRMSQTTVTEVKAAGQEIKTTLSQDLDSTWTVEKANDDGSADMSQAIVRIKTKIESAFGAFEFDSADEKPAAGPLAAQVAPLLKALVGAKFTYTMAADGSLSNVKVPAGLVESLKKAGATAASPGLFSEEGLKNMVAESSLELPPATAGKGATWSRQVKVASPPAGTLVTDKTYTLLGPEGPSERIGLDVKVTLDPGPKPGAEVSLVGQSGRGQYLFDQAAGRVTESNLKQKVEMVIASGGQKITQSTDTTTLMKLVDGKAPAAK